MQQGKRSPGGIDAVMRYCHYGDQALVLLGAEDVFPIGAGGVNGGEGSITLCVMGEKTDEIFELVQKVKEKKGEF